MATVACDLDGVVANIEPEIHKRISENFGVDISEIRKDNFYMHERFNIAPEAMDAFIRSDLCFGDPQFWLQAPTYSENIHALWDAYDVGHQIHFVTGRHNYAREATKGWLFRHIPIYSSLLMETLQVKHKALLFLGADVMFEDRFSEAQTIAQQGFKSYLIDTEYNQQEITEPLMCRVPNIRTGLELEGIL